MFVFFCEEIFYKSCYFDRLAIEFAMVFFLFPWVYAHTHAKL